MKRAAVLLLFLLLISLASASSISLNYPQIANFNEEFSVSLTLNDFNPGEYDIKIDINNETARLSEIWNGNDWQTSYNYVNGAINTNISNSANFRIRIVKNWKGQGIVTVKTRGPEDRVFTNFTIEINSQQVEEPEEYEWAIDNETKEFEADNEYDAILRFNNFKAGEYNIKLDLIKNNAIISETYDDSSKDWDSDYYIKNVEISEDTRKVFQLRLKKEWQNFSGKATLEIKIRKNGETEPFTSRSMRVDIVPGQRLVNLNEASGETVINESEAIDLTKDIKKEETVYLADSEKMKLVAILGFGLACLLVAVLFIISRKNKK